MVAGLALTLSLVGRSDAQTPPPAEPTEKTEVEDLSTPPLRILGARISLPNRSWNMRQQQVVGAAVVIRFDGVAAPLDRVGKTVEIGAIRMTPEVAGEWKWEQANRLEFTPTVGWLPPGVYRFAVGPGLLVKAGQARSQLLPVVGQRLSSPQIFEYQALMVVSYDGRDAKYCVLTKGVEIVCFTAKKIIRRVGMVFNEQGLAVDGDQ